MSLGTPITFLLFTGCVGLLTWWLTRRDDHRTTGGFFLAGRSLTFPFIAGSLLLTNLSTEQMVGLNGAAFKDGLAVMAWEVIAVVALVTMALFFLPRFLRSGIATVPQFLGERFDAGTQAFANLIFLLAYALILLPVILYSGATGLAGMLNVSELTGLASPSANLWLMVWLVGLLGSAYALFGGLRTVAVSDTLNGIGLLVGGLLITVYGLRVVGGGVGEGWRTLVRAHPERFNSLGGPESSVPFGTLFTGVLLLHLFYWCTNQQIIQRTLAASTLAEGQKGVLLTGGLKLLGPLYLVLPGLMAAHLFAGQSVEPDQAYGLLVRQVLPPALTGFFAAVMVGAILSSFNSALNSACTLYSLGVYQAWWHPQASEAEVVRSGRRFGLVLALLSMLAAPLLAGTGSIFGYLQKMNGMYFIPLFAVVLTGLLHRRVPAVAAKTALALGLLLIGIGYFLPAAATWVKRWHEFHFLGLVFVLLVAFMAGWAAVRPAPTAWVHRDVGAVDLTPWRHAGWVSALLLVLVLSIYAAFAGGA
jgi:SSS family solute:Na+ symporter